MQWLFLHMIIHVTITSSVPSALHFLSPLLLLTCTPSAKSPTPDTNPALYQPLYLSTHFEAHSCLVSYRVRTAYLWSTFQWQLLCILQVPVLLVSLMCLCSMCDTYLHTHHHQLKVCALSPLLKSMISSAPAKTVISLPFHLSIELY